jgi:hypothetical protein
MQGWMFIDARPPNSCRNENIEFETMDRVMTTTSQALNEIFGALMDNLGRLQPDLAFVKVSLELKPVLLP